ncbi:MAG: MBL fold metallo-hydrolase [Spirochaetia bacterium]|jgi:glyoxylase-like metal-dependent hydrolase (beta-lactamase superfamily II)|nr:MBL fold metallo-hydrolase [Spirochaetia bacterium]
MQITSDIFQIGGTGERGALSDPADASIYLIKDGKQSAIVDSGCGGGTERVLENMKACGVEESDIAYIFLTHCHFDHTGGANALRKATAAKIVAHEKDAVFITSGDKNVTGAEWYGGHIAPTPVDIVVSGNKKEFRLDKLSVTMHHIPGHSPGSVVFTLLSDGLFVLFGQDVHGPIGEIILHSNRSEYQKSLEFLLTLGADILCEGHFGIYHGKEKVRKFIKSFL